MIEQPGDENPEKFSFLDITKPLKGATLIGEAKDIMTKISMSSQDIGLAAGFCGSVSGSIYVTVGQPHIKVDSITVGGR